MFEDKIIEIKVNSTKRRLAEVNQQERGINQSAQYDVANYSYQFLWCGPSAVAQLGARPRGFKFRLKKQSKSWENDVNDF